jgi:sugar phosphate isomerase/epimerase
MKALSLALRRREKRGRVMLQCFRPVLASLIPVLEKHKVTLALENMPYLEGFPDEHEMTALLDEFSGAPVKAWFDTGHHLVRVNHGWVRGHLPFPPDSIAGMHLNDVESVNDDHLAPGEGKVDFAALKNIAQEIPHLVFEPSPDVSEESLKRALGFIRGLWK